LLVAHDSEKFFLRGTGSWVCICVDLRLYFGGRFSGEKPTESGGLLAL
jgi:hypothetical protein